MNGGNKTIFFFISHSFRVLSSKIQKANECKKLERGEIRIDTKNKGWKQDKKMAEGGQKKQMVGEAKLVTQFKARTNYNTSSFFYLSKV